MNFNQKCVDDIRLIIDEARQKAYKATSNAMVDAYWLIGKRIVEEEQQGLVRAAYGKETLLSLSKELGTGFSSRNLRDFRQFYLTFKDWEIWHTLCAKLNWSHIRLVMRVTDQAEQAYYLKEAADNIWAVRTLERNINTLYYKRLLSSQIQKPVVDEMVDKTKEFQMDTMEFIKNPVVLEFLNIPTNYAYVEKKLEQALIDNLQHFLLELGKGFSFVARQKHIRTDTADFFIDLVFYNYILKCFVIIELKTEKITHQDIGQLDMYVRMFDDLQKQATDNPTIGILLCTETDNTIAKYSVLNQNPQLFATKYMPYLPTEAELIAEIEREKLIIKQQFENEL